MRTCTVRLDRESADALDEMRKLTGLPTSELLRRGLRALMTEVARARVVPWDVYRELELGPGGYAEAPASDSARAVKDVIRRKHHR